MTVVEFLPEELETMSSKIQSVLLRIEGIEVTDPTTTTGGILIKAMSIDDNLPTMSLLLNQLGSQQTPAQHRSSYS